MESLENVEKPKKNHGKLKLAILIIIFALAVVLVAIALYVSYMWKKGDFLNRETMFTSSSTTEPDFVRVEVEAEVTSTPEPTEYDGKVTVEHNGKYYVLNDDLFSILFMGIDTTDDKQYENIGTNSNQSDSLILAVVDPEANKLTMINIPRNSITDVKQLDMNFNYARTTKSPICIQHSFGDGAEMSCELTREAASNLLFGLEINRYVSMNLDGLFVMNDSIGGVTLELLDDMTEFNPDMKKGEVYTLTGKDAEIYVARRIGKNLDNTNMSRVKRQVQYYKAFFASAKDKLKDDPMFAVNMYGSMKDSIHTDLSIEEIIYLSKTVINMDMNDDSVHTLEGVVENEDYYVDDVALKDLLIRVFYTEVPN